MDFFYADTLPPFPLFLRSCALREAIARLILFFLAALYLLFLLTLLSWALLYFAMLLMRDCTLFTVFTALASACNVGLFTDAGGAAWTTAAASSSALLTFSCACAAWLTALTAFFTFVDVGLIAAAAWARAAFTLAFACARMALAYVFRW